MNLKTAEQLIPCYREDRNNDSKVEKAVKVAEGDATLRESLAAQKRWDAQLVDVIHSIEPPEDFRKRLLTYGPKGGKAEGKSALQRAGILAVILGILVTIGLLVKGELERREAFQGREAVIKMLNVARSMEGVELEPVHGQAWQLGDWFYMRGFEGFSLPPDVANMEAVGSRIFRQGGMPVAQIAVDKHNLLVYVFRPTDFSVELPEEDEWRVFEHEGWAAAIRRKGSICTLLAFRGSKSEMHSLVDSFGK